MVVRSKYSFFFLALFVLQTGCSVSVEYYVRNLSNSDILLEFFVQKNTDSVITVRYSDSVELPDRKLSEKLRKTLQYVHETDSYLSVKMPPHSTVACGMGINFNNLLYKMIVVNRTDTIYFDKSYFNFKRIAAAKFLGYRDLGG